MKKIFSTIIVIVLVLCLSSSIYANGGPKGTSGRVEGGNIEFKNVEDVFLKKEKLDIILDVDYVNVKVEYLLENEGEALTTDYAFPVTFYKDEFTSFEKVENLNMYVNDEKINYTVTEGEIFEDKEKFISTKTDYYLSTLNFAKGEELKLTIEYKIAPHYINWGTSKNPFISIDYKKFYYDLSPAANWGDGKIDKFYMTIDASKIIEKGGKIVESTFSGLDLSQSVISYEAENFDILSNSELILKYDIHNYLMQQYVAKRSAASQISRIITSSCLDAFSYGALNLVDNDLTTCWAEGSEGLGIGDWVEIEFKEPVDIEFIYMANGFLLDEKTFYNNARVKKLDVELDVYDPVNGYGLKMLTIEFPDLQYPDGKTEFTDLNFEDMCQKITSYNEKVSNIKIIIKEVYPGDKFEDLCISEILLFGISSYPESTQTIQVEHDAGGIIQYENSDDADELEDTIIETSSENSQVESDVDSSQEIESGEENSDEMTNEEDTNLVPFIVIGVVVIVIGITATIIVIIRKKKKK